ncbi:MAG: hypothetical protein Fur0015_00580 [Ignavibacteriales bacterium]
MKKTVFFIVLVFLCSHSFAQFSSVKDGEWQDAKTWSTDPNATAIPDSNSSVIVNHRVVAKSLHAETECKNLTISQTGIIDNYMSTWVSGDLTVKNNLINNGKIDPAFDFTLYVGGDFINNGIITSHNISTKQQLYLFGKGSIYNNGSFHFTNTTISKYRWKISQTLHEHIIRAMNDSSICLGDVSLQDSMGVLIIDSITTINAKINLNGSKIVLPPSLLHPNQLILDNANVFAGNIEANGNKIKTKENSWAYLGYIFSDVKNMKIFNADLEGNFAIGSAGPFTSGANFVSFVGETTFNGKMIDWYSSNIWSAGDRMLQIEGSFENYGILDNWNISTGYSFYIKQMNESVFKNYGKIKTKGIYFEGECNFYPNDTLFVSQFKAVDSNTVVSIHNSDLVFGNNSITEIDFSNGKLILSPNSKMLNPFTIWLMLRNIKLEANNSVISASIYEHGNASINNAKINYLYPRGYSDYTHKITGDVEITGTLANFWDHYPILRIESDLVDYGRVINNSAGTLTLKITGDIKNDGNEWKTEETIFEGNNDQSIALINDKPLQGKITFESVSSGGSYQWQKDGTDIPNATTKSLSFNSGINSSHYGTYKCFVDGTPTRKILVGNKNISTLEIYDVAIDVLTSSDTRITWKTTVPSNGFVFYSENDTTSGFPSEAMEPEGLVVNHEIVLGSLNSGSTYYFIIDQMDKDWNNVRSKTYSFVSGEQDPTIKTPFDSALATLKKLTNVPDEEGSVYYDGAFISNDVAYIVSNHNRLFKTVDGGKTWEDVSPDIGNDYNKIGNAPRVHFLNEKIGTVAFSNDDGANNYNYDLVFGYVWCTTDGGKNWSQRFDVNDDQISHLQQVSETEVYVSGQTRLGVASNRWFKKITRDAVNGTYTLSNITPTPQERPHVASGNWLNSTTGVVLGRQNVQPWLMSIYKTTDGGLSWQSINGNLPTMESVQTSFSDNAISILAEDTYVFLYYYPTGNGYDTKIWYTENGGVSWNNSPIVDSDVTLNSLCIDRSGDYGLICGGNADSSKIFYVMYPEETAWKPYLLKDVKSGTGLYSTGIANDGTI